MDLVTSQTEENQQQFFLLKLNAFNKAVIIYHIISIAFQGWSYLHIIKMRKFHICYIIMIPIILNTTDIEKTLILLIFVEPKQNSFWQGSILNNQQNIKPYTTLI